MTIGASGTASLRPQAADGLGLGAVLALLAHVLLLAALAFGVNWRTHNASVVEAEVWSEVPQAAAPREAPPPPPPPEPAPEVPAQEAPPPPPPEVEAPLAEIAQAPQPKPLPKPKKEPKVKKEEKKEPKPKKVKEPAETFVATTKPTPAKPAPAKKPATEVASKQPPAPTAATSAEREALRKANLQRMMNDLGGLGQSSRSAGASASYGGKVRARILPNIVFTGTLNGNPTTFVEIRCAPDGRIISRRLLDSSGSPEWDNAVLRGIDKTESLPLDDNGRLPDTVFEIGFSLRDKER